MSKKTERRAEGQIGIPQAMRDVLIASINKGQFLLAVVALIIITMIIRMPEKDVSLLAFSILDRLGNGSYFGYILASLSTTGWFFHARFQRRIIVDELERLSTERTQLQHSQLGNNVKSSRGD